MSDGKVNSAQSKNVIHLGAGSFEQTFGKKQTRIIKRLCHDHYVKARQVIQCISNIYDFNCESMGIKQRG